MDTWCKYSHTHTHTHTHMLCLNTHMLSWHRHSLSWPCVQLHLVHTQASRAHVHACVLYTPARTHTCFPCRVFIAAIASCACTNLTKPKPPVRSRSNRVSCLSYSKIRKFLKRTQTHVSSNEECESKAARFIKAKEFHALRWSIYMQSTWFNVCVHARQEITYCYFRHRHAWHARWWWLPAARMCGRGKDHPRQAAALCCTEHVLVCINMRVVLGWFHAQSMCTYVSITRITLVGFVYHIRKWFLVRFVHIAAQSMCWCVSVIYASGPIQFYIRVRVS
jgi:hypothetical protein